MKPLAKQQLFKTVKEKLIEVGRTTFIYDDLTYEVEKDGDDYSYTITHKGKELDGGDFVGDVDEFLRFATFSNEHLKKDI